MSSSIAAVILAAMLGLRQRSGLVGVALVALVACSRTASIGGFELEVPRGWEASHEGGSLVLADKDLLWTWAFVTKEAGELAAHEGGLSGAGSEMVAKVAADPSKSAGGELSFAEPVELSLEAGVLGISITGKGSSEAMNYELRLIIVVGGDDALVGIGFRGPDEAGAADAESEALLGSIRLR